MMPEVALLADRPAEGVVRLRLNRPERRNALTTPLLQDIAASLREAEKDDTVRVAIIVGSATVFAARR